MPWLICSHGSDKGMTQELIAPTYTMGRAPDCDLILVEEKVSRHHCRLGCTGKQFWVEDLNSSNGVKFKGKRYRRKKFKIKEKEVFAIGNDCFYFTKTAPDLLAEAAREIDKELKQEDSSKLAERTYLDAINATRKRKEGGLSGFFSIFRHRD